MELVENSFKNLKHKKKQSQPNLDLNEYTHAKIVCHHSVSIFLMFVWIHLLV